MRRHILLLVSVVMLLGCASDPPPRYTPAPEASPAPVPEPVPEPEPPKEDGQWRVSLISVKTETKAERLTRLFADKGYRVETEVVEFEGTTWQRIVFPGQYTRDEAQLWLAKLEQEFGITGGWIPPRKAEP